MFRVPIKTNQTSSLGCSNLLCCVFVGLCHRTLLRFVSEEAAPLIYEEKKILRLLSSELDV